MSGGSLDSSFRVEMLADQITEIIDKNGSEHSYPDEIISKFKDTVTSLKQSSLKARLVDRLLSGDESRESFLTEWQIIVSNKI